MSNWPLQSAGNLFEAAGASAATSRGTYLGTTGYTELIASTTYPWAGFWVYIDNSLDATNRRALTEIAVGAAGAEVNIIKLITYTPLLSISAVTPVYVPVAVPAGSRLSGRCVTNSAQIYLALTGVPPTPLMPEGGGSFSLYGCSNESTVVCTTVEPSASANTEGSWVEITSGLNARTKALLIYSVLNASGADNNGDYLLDVAIGGSGSEVAIISDLPFQHQGDRRGRLPMVLGPYYVDLPAGTRVAMRCQNSIGDTGTTSDMYLAMVGIE